MEAIALTGELRKASGKKAAKAVRSEGRIPAVLYGGSDVIHFSTTHNEVKKLIFTPDFKIVDLSLDGKTHRCIIKDVQWHPVTDAIIHIDFLRLVDGHPVKVEIPVRFKGTSPGERSGGKLQQAIRRVKVKTVPEKLVEQLMLDVSDLEMGHSIRVRDIEAVEGMEIMNPPGTPIATVEVPRALRSAEMAEAEAAEEAAAAEGATEEAEATEE